MSRPALTTTVEERIYDALFRRPRGLNASLALHRRIWPDPKPEILAAIRRAITRDSSTPESGGRGRT